MTKILIEVRGGLIQAVHSDKEDIKIVVIDWDNIEKGDSPTGMVVCEPDTLTENMHTLFNDESDPQIMEARNELKKLKF